MTRKVYQRAVVVPLRNMDKIWKDYEGFEKSIPNNEALGQNFMKIYRPKFEAARAVLNDRLKYWEAVQLNVLAVPSTGNRPDEQLVHWKQFIQFEIGNPEMLDPMVLKTRVRFAFEQCLSIKRYQPEIWYQYASFERDGGDAESAALTFQRGIQVMPSSELLSLAYADHQEARGDIEVWLLYMYNVIIFFIEC